MKKTDDPCSICEAFIEGIECANNECPVYKIKAENKMLKETVSSLRAKIQRMKSAASWDEDIRRGQVQGMW